MKPLRAQAGLAALALVLVVPSVSLLYTQSLGSDWHDFDVYYGAASSTLAGGSPYIVVGKYQLPFWYLPWTAWQFVPFAVWPKSVALFLYQAASLVCGILAIGSLSRHYSAGISISEQLIMVALAIPMTLQVVQVGQMEFLFLGLLVAVMLAAQSERHVLVGILYPFLLAKPHLLVPFTIVLFWRLGTRAFLTALSSLVLLLMIGSVAMPGWHLDMLSMLKEYGGRTAGLPFTTLPALLGRQENWLGTANLLLTATTTILALLLLWRVRRLPTLPLLSLALALSLFAAPRAYAYDLPLLIPALIWMTAGRLPKRLWLWLLAALIPLITIYTTGAYVLTMLICGLGVVDAVRQTRAMGTSAEVQG